MSCVQKLNMIPSQAKATLKSQNDSKWNHQVSLLHTESYRQFSSLIKHVSSCLNNKRLLRNNMKSGTVRFTVNLIHHLSYFDLLITYVISMQHAFSVTFFLNESKLICSSLCSINRVIDTYVLKVYFPSKRINFHIFDVQAAVQARGR